MSVIKVESLKNELGKRGWSYGEVERGTRVRTNESNKGVQLQQEVREISNAMVTAIFSKEVEEGRSENEKEWNRY